MPDSTSAPDKAPKRRKFQLGVLLAAIAAAASKALPALEPIIPPQVAVAILTGASIISAFLPKASAPQEEVGE